MQGSVGRSSMPLGFPTTFLLDVWTARKDYRPACCIKHASNVPAFFLHALLAPWPSHFISISDASQSYPNASLNQDSRLYSVHRPGSTRLTSVGPSRCTGRGVLC